MLMNPQRLRGVPHLCRLHHRPWNQSDKWGQRLVRQAFRQADMHTAPTSCPRLQNYGPGDFSAVANTAGDAKTGKIYNSNWRPRLIAASTLFCSWRSLLSIPAELPLSARHWSRSWAIFSAAITSTRSLPITLRQIGRASGRERVSSPV